MTFETTIHINASPDNIFALYKDVNSWNTWDPEIQESCLDGEFQEGATGSLKPSSGPRSKFTVTKILPSQSFTAKTSLPLCSIYFERTLFPDSSGTTVIHSITFDGLLAPLFGRLLGNKLKEEQLRTMKSLKKAVEHEIQT
jgi:hypothetical protein